MEKKVKIHYIWLENYYCFHNQSFNFSTQYQFNYDSQTETITVDEKNSRYIDNFFGENIDLTAVVGMNGTGKTTLLRFIQELRNGDIIDTECVIVCENNCKFCAVRYYRIDGQITCEQLQIEGCENIDKHIVCKNIELPYEKQRFLFSKDIRFVYLTEMFNMNQYTSSIAGGDDLSFASVLYSQTEYGDEEKHIKNPVVRYIHRINDWQLAFLSNGREFVEQFKINFPSCVTIELSYDQNAFADLYVRIKSGSKKAALSSQDDDLKREARKYLRGFLNRSESTNNISLRDEYATAIFMNIISTIQYVISMNKDEGKILFDMIDRVRVSSNSKNAWDTVYELLKKINDNNQKFDNLLNKRMKPADKKIDYISVNAGRYIEFMDYLYDFLSDENRRYTRFPLSWTIMIPTNNMEEVRIFFNNYKKCVGIVDFISFSWGLSSGETLLLNQFGKLTHLLKKDRKGNHYLPEDVNSDTPAKNAVILLDEAEVAFHPEWQRTYLDAFLKFIKKNISEHGTHVQIILATHSPIILSDIPKQNAIFLTRDKNNKITSYDDKEETFAANIFSLYQNAFFMNESGIGVFAEKKLCELIDKIHQLPQSGNDYRTLKEEIIRKIGCIGDPYIRHKFAMECEDVVRHLTGSELETEIKEMEARLKELKDKLELGDKYAEN